VMREAHSMKHTTLSSRRLCALGKRIKAMQDKQFLFGENGKPANDRANADEINAALNSFWRDRATSGPRITQSDSISNQKPNT